MNLPRELYREILQHVSAKPDLCALSVASRSLQGEAEYFLYQSMRATTPSAIQMLCGCLFALPRVHPFVRSLALIDLHGTGELTRWADIACVLRHLPNLESLTLTGFKDKATAWVLSSCPFSLRELACEFELDSAFLSFLGTQRELHSLSWTHGYINDVALPHFPADHHLMPSLRVLSVNVPGPVLKMMAGRPLTHIWLNGPFTLDEEQIMCTAENDVFTPHLCSLRMYFPFNQHRLVTSLRAIAETSPYMRSLGFLPNITTKDTEVVEAISAFRHLELLATWSVISSDTAHALAQACPTLRLVACLHYSYYHEYVLLPVNPIGVPRPVHDPEFDLWKST